MTKFKFVGDPSGFDRREETEMHGILFPRDKPVQVPGGLAAKFRAHSHFEEVAEAPKPVRKGRVK